MAINLTYEEAKIFGVERHHPDHNKAAPQEKKEKSKLPPGSRMSKPEKLMGVFLLGRKAAGVILDCKYEAINLRLAEKCWYKPDWCLWLPDRSLVFVECKGGYIWDDAVVKYKAAAESWPCPFFRAKYMQNKWTIRQLPGPGWREDLQDFFAGI